MADSNLKVIWSPRAELHYLKIREYLLSEFTQRELDSFNSLIQKFELTVIKFPEIYPETSFRKNVRRAVLKKVVSIFYRVNREKIEIVAVFDNRQDIQSKL